jgi:hypothetical protein
VLDWLPAASGISNGYIVVMWAAENRRRHDMCIRAVHGSIRMNRGALFDSLVRPNGVEAIQSVLLQNALQVSLVQNDNVIQTFAPNTAVKALAN